MTQRLITAAGTLVIVVENESTCAVLAGVDLGAAGTAMVDDAIPRVARVE